MTDLAHQPPTPEEIAWFDRALLRLPAKRRNIFLLHGKEGLSYEEIADLYGMSAGRVRWHVAEAIPNLRREQEGLHRPWWREVLGRFF